MSIRTDIAHEAIELGKIETNEQIVEHLVENERFKITKVTVDDAVKEQINKNTGTYYTIETDAFIHPDHELLLEIQKELAEIIKSYINNYNISEDSTVMVVGLGNDLITPDALGPKVIDDIFVTKHIFDLHPEEMNENFRPVCAIAPGVMGTTGIETYEIIESIVKKVNPNLIIVIDALAAGSIERVNKTIQVSDAGINPGSGVGNKRKEISKNSLGIPVIAIGVPTVVDAVSITSGTLEILIKYINNQLVNDKPANKLVTSATNKYNPNELPEPTEKSREHFLGQIGLLAEHEKKQIIHEALTPTGLNHIVTSKDVDKNIEDLAHVISRGINLSLHRDVN